MDRVTIATTWGAHQSNTLGLEWLRGAHLWPNPWQPLVYGEPPVDPSWTHTRWYDTTNFVDFQAERANEVAERAPAGRPILCGRVPTACWRAAERQGGYSFRTDLRRFAWKAFALLAAARRQESGILVWLDADVRTIAAPPADLWEQLAGPAAVSWLDRSPNYPDTGCLIFRLPAARPFFERYADHYERGEVMRLDQWHDAWVTWQIILEHRSQQPLAIDWLPLARSHRSDVWSDSPLARYFSHEKGFKRKIAAYGSA